MSDPQAKLIGTKQVIILVFAMCTGIAINLYRQHHENGTLTNTNYIAVGGTVVMFALILIFMIKKGNKQ